VAKAIGYMLSRWASFTRFLEDGRVCMTNNAAERAIRPLAVGPRNWTFAGSDAGGRRAAAMYTLIETRKLNDVDPRAWLADVLARLPSIPPRASTSCGRGIGRLSPGSVGTPQPYTFEFRRSGWSSVHVGGPCPLGSPHSASNPSWSSMLVPAAVRLRTCSVRRRRE
jgi:Transposase IS66 family/IS66 C-terminal element